MERKIDMTANRTYFTPIRLFVFILLMILLWMLLVPHAKAAAGIRRTVNFQGKLVNKADGTNITDGSYSFTFKFYDASSGGTQLPSGAAWSETQTLTVTNGIFRAELGSSTVIPTTMDFNADNIYLDITFNGETFGSRVRMTAVPYAFNAEKVGGLTVTSTTGTLTIPNGKTISFADAFTTSGANPLTLTTTGTTNATLPTGTITLVDLASTQTLTSKSIGSTGLTFSGATTDITTGTNEDFNIVANGTGKVGIGTTSPASFFDVNGKLNVLSGGNVGIGTTNPSVKLEVNGSVLVSGTATLNGNTTIGDANTDTLTINAGTSGTGITLADSSFANCTLKTVSNVVTCGTSGSFTSFTAAGDTGSNQSITDGNTLTIAGGTNGIDTVGTATDIVTLNLDTTEIGDATFGSGSGFTWTFDSGSGTDPSAQFASNAVYFTAGTASFSNRLGIGTTAPSASLAVGATSQFQVNSSGQIAAAAGISSSGTIAFSGLSSNGYVKTTGGTGTLSVGTTIPSSDVSGTLFTAAGDSGSGAIVQGNTLSILATGNGIDTSESGTTVTLTLDTTEIGDATFGSGSGFTWTFDSGSGTDPSAQFASNALYFTAGTASFSNRLGIGTTAPSASLAVGATSQFQVNSSGQIAAAAGISSSGTIAFSGLSSNGYVKTTGGTGTLSVGTTIPSSDVSGTLFTAAGDSGSGAIVQGNTLTIAGGTNGIDTSESGTTVTLNLDTTEIGTTTFGSGGAMTWTFDSGSGTDPTEVFGSAYQQFTAGTASFSNRLGIGTTAPTVALDVAGSILVSGTATLNGNTTIGDANTDTLTINAGTSGTGITLADSSFANCTLKTVSNVVTCGTSGSFTSFTAAGDTGSNQSITDGNTLTIAGGTNGIDTVGTATDIVTLNLDTTEIGTTTFGSGGAMTWTFDSGSGTDPTEIFGSAQQIFTAGTASFSNRLGIGTTAPTTALDVVGTFKLSGSATLSAYTGNGYIKTTGGTGTLAIGTTVPSTDVSGTLFTAAGDSGSGAIVQGNTLSILATGNGIDTSESGTTVTLTLDTTEIANSTFGSGSGFTWTFDSTGGTDPTAIFGSNQIQFTAGTASFSGKLGIGTTAPTQALTILTATSNYGLLHTDGTTSVGTYVNGASGQFGTFSNHDLTFFTNNGSTQLLLQKSTGNLGVGTTNPTSLLSVGASSQFQVNTSGQITAAAGISSSGTIAFSGLSSNGYVKTTGGTGTLSVGTTIPSSDVSGTLFTAAGDSGSGAIVQGNTLSILATGNGIDTSESGTTVTLTLDTTEIANSTFGSGSGYTWTFDSTGGTDTTIAFGNNQQIFTAGTASFSTALGIGTTAPTTALDVAGGFKLSGSATLNGNTAIGDANTDTLTINAGTSGTGIRLNDSTFANCTLTTVSNVVTCGTSGSFTSFTAAGDSGSNQTITDGNTLSIAGGTNGIDTVGTATDIVTLNLDTTEIGTTTFGSGGAMTWTFDSGSGTDPTEIFGSAQQIFTAGTASFSNRLGIGTTAPTTALDVVGTFKLSGSATLSAYTTNGYIKTTGGTGTLSIGTTIPSSDVSGTLFTAAGDSGSGAIVQGNTLTIAGGTNGIDTSESGTTVTLNLDTTEIGTTTFGSGGAMTWTFDASAGTDTSLAFGDNLMTATTTNFRVTTGTGGSIDIAYTDNNAGYGEFNFRDTTSGNNKWAAGALADSYASSVQQNDFYIFQKKDKSESTINAYRLVINDSGNLGIGTTNPSALFSVGASSQFQVNTSGQIAAAAGISSSGTIAFSGLSSNGYVKTTGGTGTLSVGTTIPSTDVSGTLFTAAGDSGSGAIVQGNTLSILATGNGIDTSESGTTVTLTLDTTEIGTTTFGSGGAMTWTFDSGAGTDPTEVFGSASQQFTAGTASFSGRVGIGTTAPGYAFDVVSASATTARFKSTGANNAGFILDNEAGGNQSFFSLSDAGTVKWQIGKQTDNTFFLWDQANSKDVIHTSGANLYLEPVSGNVYVGVSDTSGSLLVLDTKTDAEGALTGANGGMYYNSNLNKFRCYENSAWTNCIGSGSGMTSFTAAGDSGSNQTITDGNTFTIAGGTNGIDTVGTATDIVTLNLDTTEIGTTTFGSGGAMTWTFDSGSGTDPSAQFASNALYFTAGTASFSGRLGIGTTAPASPLTVNSSSYGIEQTNGTVRLSTYLDAFGGWLGTRTAHPLVFYTSDSASRMMISSTGLVGIGTTLPSSTFQVGDDGSAIRAQYGSPVYGLSIDASSAGGWDRAFGFWNSSGVASLGGFGGYGGSANAITRYYIGTDYLTNVAVFDQVNSRVGIGLVGPSAKLDVSLASTSSTGATEYGYRNTVADTGIVTSGTDTTYGGYISLTRTGATGGTINSTGLYITATGDNAGAGTSKLVGLQVDTSSSTADTTYAAIFNGGNVGIGTTNPGAALEVNGLVRVSGTNQLQFNTNGDIGYVSGSNQILFENGSTEKITLQTTTSGNIEFKPGGSSYVTIGTSDTTASLLVLDTKTDAEGALTGTNGAMYYNSNTNKFRCYQASAWTNCIGTGSGASGSGAAGQAAYWSDASTLAGSNNFFWDNTNGRLGIGTSAPAVSLQSLATTEQFRIGYDATNYQSFTVNSTAGLTIKNSVNSTAGLQFQNLSSANLLAIDSTNNKFDILSNNSGELNAWASTSTTTGTANTNTGTATYHGYLYAVGGYNPLGSTGTTTVQYAKINQDGTVGTWTATTSLNSGRSGCAVVAAQGFLYCIGGFLTNTTSTIQYAKINQDGTVGTWTTQTNTIVNDFYDGAFGYYNGYIYLVGGMVSGAASTQTQYAKINADGSTGTWATTGALAAARVAPASAIVNGYFYAIGGNITNFAGAPQTNVQYSKIASDGTLAAFTNQGSNLPTARSYASGATINGYIYIIGGDLTGPTATNTIQYAAVTSTGATGAWTTETNNLVAARDSLNSVATVANGYIYIVNGQTGSSGSNTTYYASAPRVKINGALDLVSGDGAFNLAEGGSAGSLTAGNADIIGSLAVRSDAVVRGSFDVQGRSYFADDVSFTKVKMADAASVTFDDGTATTANSDLPLGRLKEYFSTANYGVFEAQGFINIDGSFRMDNFLKEGAAAITADQTGTSRVIGDYMNWSVDEAATGAGGTNTQQVGCSVRASGADTNFTDALNGQVQMRLDSTTVTNAINNWCILHMNAANGSTQGNFMNLANKWIVYYKVRLGAAWTSSSTANYAWIGASNITAGTAGKFTATSNNNGIWFSNVNGALTQTGTNATAGSAWIGEVHGGTAATNYSTVSCSSANLSVNTSTSAWALMRIEGRATNDVHFFIDPDTSNGVSLSECGTGITSNIPTNALHPQIMDAVLGTRTTTNLDLIMDLFAFVQDDPRGGSATQAGLAADTAVAPAPVEERKPDAIAGADLAEHYYIPDPLAYSGDIVSADTFAGAAKKSSTPYDRKLLGVISSSPGLQIGESADKTKPVALSGRVPVNVSAKNGPIKIGDPITSSDMPGVGVKATKAGKIVGTALENYSANENGTILVNINVGYYLGDDVDTGLIEKGNSELGLSDKPIASLSGILATDSAHIASGSADLAQTIETVKDSIFKGAIEFWNKVTFKGIAEYLAEVFFRSNVHFDGQVEFSNDSAGYATIKQGERFVDVKFDKEYKNEPIVNISITIPKIDDAKFKELITSGDCDAAGGLNACQDKMASAVLADDLKGAVTAKTAQGFIILLSRAAPADITYSWQAVAVKEAKTSVSKSTADLVKDLEKTASSAAQAGQVAGESTSSAELQIRRVLEKEASQSSRIRGDASVNSKKGTIKQTDLGYVRLRSKASVDAEELDQIPSGIEVTYTATEGSWYEVTYKGKTGWVSGEYISKL